MSETKTLLRVSAKTEDGAVVQLEVTTNEYFDGAGGVVRDLLLLGLEKLIEFQLTGVNPSTVASGAVQ